MYTTNEDNMSIASDPDSLQKTHVLDSSECIHSLSDPGDITNKNSGCDITFHESEDDEEDSSKAGSDSDFDGINLSPDSDSSSNTDNDETDKNLTLKDIYPGAPITVGESMLSTLSMFLRHDISDSLLSDMLEWLEMHCPQPNHCAKSVYLFKKWFREFEIPLIRHYYCPQCSKKLLNAAQKCSDCKNVKSSPYIIEIPIVSQLQKIFNRPGFFNSSNHRFYREKNNNNNFEDIYDGSAYSSYLVDNDIFDLNSPYIISHLHGIPMVFLFFNPRNLGCGRFFYK